MKNFVDLIAWQKGHKLVLETYQRTRKFPREEMFGLASQMQRCAVSVTSNIAEGYHRTSIKEKLQFYSIANGSLAELWNQFLVARDLGYISQIDFDAVESMITEAGNLIGGLMKSTRSRL